MSLLFRFQVKVEWSRQLREQQSQKTEQIRKETDRIKAVADAEREKAVLLVRMRRLIANSIKQNQINLSLGVNNLISFQITLEKKELAKAGERNISILQNEINRRRKVTSMRQGHHIIEEVVPKKRIVICPTFPGRRATPTWSTTRR